MNLRLSRNGILTTWFFLLSAGLSAQSVVITPVPASDSSLTTQGGLLVGVVAENKAPLDRQAVVKAYNKQTQNVVWQTTGYEAQASLDALGAGEFEIEVSAVGYLTSTVDVNIPTPNTLYQIHLTLQKDPTAIELKVPSREDQMPAKVRKEMRQGITALKSGKLKQAQKQLEAAHALVPSDADIHFLLGYLFFQEKDFKQAEMYLTETCTLDHHNVQALNLLGRLEIQRQDYAAASKTLEEAVSVDPDYWMTHSLLAETYLGQQEYEKARQQAELAIDKGKDAGNSSEIALGRALEGLGRNDEALVAYKSFIEKAPSSPMAAQVRAMHNDLARRLSNPSQNASEKKASAFSPATNALLAGTVPGLLTRNWGPLSIDEVKPNTAEGVSCPYEKVRDGAAQRIKELVDDVERFNAIEELMHEDLNELDRPTTRTVFKFNYVASIAEPQPGMFTVNEFRDQRSSADDFPDQIATRGLPALALIFHPDERDDFEMACEGLGEWRHKATWLIRFEQRQDRPHRIQDYKIAGRSYPVSLKGRAWISADTFHIVHLESDLVSPMPEIQLLSEHMDVDYGPVMFQKKGVELWLPKSADIYFDFRRHHYLMRHSFDHFMLFSIDSEEKRNEPRVTKTVRSD